MIRLPLRVCLVSPIPPPYGGIAHWTALISSYARDRQDIVISQINTAPKWRSIHQTGIIIRSIGGSLQLLSDIGKLFFSLCGARFDAIHLTTSGHLGAVRDLAVAILGKFFGVPLVFHIRFGRIPAIALANSFEWRLLRTVMRMSSRVVLIDKATFEAVRGYFPASKIVLIPNCVNTHSLPVGQSQDGPSDTRSVLFLGWIIQAKGVEELLSAWSRLQPRGWQLDLIGSYKPDYRDKLVQSYGAKNVNFLGELPHHSAMQHMASCDLFVLPSHTEGFPNVIVEAMALGRAIVATNVGAIPEMLEGGAGVLVNPRDACALEGEMRALISDARSRASLGEVARKKAIDCYSIDAVFLDYMRIWRGVSNKN